MEKNKTIYLIRYILFIWAMYTGMLNGFAQSDISMFQLIQQPVSVVYLDSISDTGSINEELGDSIDLSLICVLEDISDVNTIHFNIGNTSGFNLVQDTVLYSGISTNPIDLIYRSGSVIYMDCGRFAKTDTLYGEALTTNALGEEGVIKYYE